jgi:hypothetical protein
MFAIVISSRSDFDYLFCEGLKELWCHYWAGRDVSQAIRTGPWSATLALQKENARGERAFSTWG